MSTKNPKMPWAQAAHCAIDLARDAKFTPERLVIYRLAGPLPSELEDLREFEGLEVCLAVERGDRVAGTVACVVEEGGDFEIFEVYDPEEVKS